MVEVVVRRYASVSSFVHHYWIVLVLFPTVHIHLLQVEWYTVVMGLNLNTLLLLKKRQSLDCK